MSEPKPSSTNADVATLRPPPRHVAIIMDGNGRWAKARGLPRALGHKEGVEALRRAVEASRELGLTHLSVYAFSTENWNRPQTEIDALFDLLRVFVRRDLARLHNDGDRVRIIGSRDGLGADILALIDEAVQGAQQIPNTVLSIDQSLLLVWPQVVALIALTVLCFVAAYVAFMRQEVRA